MHIFLDMDGVIADLEHSVLSANNRMDLYGQTMALNLEEQLGKPWREVWKIFIDSTKSWEDVPVFPWTYELISFVESLGNVTVVTRPLGVDKDFVGCGTCVSGKLLWLSKHYPGVGLHNISFTANKSLLARPGSILLDDDERLLTAYEAEGGRVVVFPQPYNRMKAYTDDRMASVKSQFREIIEDANSYLRAGTLRKRYGERVVC